MKRGRRLMLGDVVLLVSSNCPLVLFCLLIMDNCGRILAPVPLCGSCSRACTAALANFSFIDKPVTGSTCLWETYTYKKTRIGS